MGSDKSGKHLIHITHFFNPHHFWFKFTDVDQSKLNELNELDARIYEYATKRRIEKKWCWRIGDIIAAYNIIWNKWVRVRVENVIEVNNGTPRYYLWAIDYGIPMNAIGNNTSPLPTELSEFDVFAVHEGCIYGIMPAQQTFDVKNLETKMTPTKEWSKKAIEMCKDILKAAAFTVFEINDQFIDSQYEFGSLSVQLYNGDIKDVTKSLKDLHHAIETDAFDFEIDEIKSQNKFNRIQCTRNGFQEDDDDTDETEKDSVTSFDSGDQCVQATLKWINGDDFSTDKSQNDDDQSEVRSISAGVQHQSRLEKLKYQPPRSPRPLKYQAASNDSNGLSDVDIQRFERNVTIPTRRARFLNSIPILTGHERETNEFLKCNPNDSF